MPKNRRFVEFKHWYTTNIWSKLFLKLFHCQYIPHEERKKNIKDSIFNVKYKNVFHTLHSNAWCSLPLSINGAISSAVCMDWSGGSSNDINRKIKDYQKQSQADAYMAMEIYCITFFLLNVGARSLICAIFTHFVSQKGKRQTSINYNQNFWWQRYNIKNDMMVNRISGKRSF